MGFAGIYLFFLFLLQNIDCEYSLEPPRRVSTIYCNVQPSQATANPVGGKACSSTKGGLLRYIPKGGYPVTLLLPPRRLVPSLGLRTTWVRQLRSGSCHYPTAATKCNMQPSQATANPVGGKACSSTKGGLLCYIPNTYSIHLVSSLKFAYFQGRLSRHTMFRAKIGKISKIFY